MTPTEWARVPKARVARAVTRILQETMTANEPTPEQRENVAGIEHELGGIEVSGTMGETLAPPESGRVVIEQLFGESDPTVSMSIRSDAMSYRVLLSADQAEAVAAEIEAAAED